MISRLLEVAMTFFGRLCMVLVFVGLICGRVFAGEPHFDLPKKDAKAFCLELNKIAEECYYNNTAIVRDDRFLRNLQKCGNIFIKFTGFSNALYDEGGGEAWLVLDEQGNYIGYNTSVFEGTILANISIANNGGYYVGDNIGVDYEELAHIPFNLVKKHKKLIENSKIVIKVEDCYVKEIKMKN